MSEAKIYYQEDCNLAALDGMSSLVFMRDLSHGREQRSRASKYIRQQRLLRKQTSS